MIILSAKKIHIVEKLPNHHLVNQFRNVYPIIFSNIYIYKYVVWAVGEVTARFGF